MPNRENTNESQITMSRSKDSVVSLNRAHLKGCLKVPSSKSVGHRAIICACLCEGVSQVNNISMSEDIEATLNAMKQFGAKVHMLSRVDGSVDLELSNPHIQAYYETGAAPIKQPLVIDCNESGSTARFLIPLFFLNEEKTVYTGTERLSERHYDAYYTLFDEQRIQYQTTGKTRGLPLTVQGSWQSGDYSVRGDISSQFISGLMFALPLLSGNSRICLSTHLESQQYVMLTDACLKAFGVEAQIEIPTVEIPTEEISTEKVSIEAIPTEEMARNENRFPIIHIHGNQRFQSRTYTVEGDYSQAAFWLVANYLGAEIRLEGLNRDSLQADRVIESIIETIIEITMESSSQTIKNRKSSNQGVDLTIDVSQSPDLVPILTVMLALTPGTWEIAGAARLRIKESDRLKAIATELSKLGADIEERPEGLFIRGKQRLHGGEVDSWNDHRIAMALAIAATCIDETVILNGSSCVNKSYPEFWEHYRKVGGQCHGK